MKSLYIAFAFTILFLIASSKTDAQVNSTKLNQIELMKQFFGIWECKLGINTIYHYDYKQFGDGLVCTVQVFAGGEVIDSVKQLYGYDTKTDKFILAELVKSPSIVNISAVLFTTENAGTILPLEPNDADIKINFVFQTPDMIKQTAELGNNYVVELELDRIKN